MYGRYNGNQQQVQISQQMLNGMNPQQQQQALQQLIHQQQMQQQQQQQLQAQNGQQLVQQNGNAFAQNQTGPQSQQQWNAQPPQQQQQQQQVGAQFQHQSPQQQNGQMQQLQAQFNQMQVPMQANGRRLPSSPPQINQNQVTSQMNGQSGGQLQSPPQNGTQHLSQSPQNGTISPTQLVNQSPQQMQQQMHQMQQQQMQQQMQQHQVPQQMNNQMQMQQHPQGFPQGLQGQQPQSAMNGPFQGAPTQNGLNPADPQMDLKSQMLANGGAASFGATPSGPDTTTITTNNNDITFTQNGANPMGTETGGTAQGTANGTISTTIDVEESTLNPEVPDFNPTNFGTVPSLQEQLFDQLQNIQVQMQTRKRQIEQVLSPMLQTINTQLTMYQMNPHLVQVQPHFSTYHQLLSQQQALNNELLISQQTYQQLEQNAAYVREQYQKNKDEQYRVDENMPISPLNEVDQVGNTLNLTGGDQPVTDANGWNSNASPMTDRDDGDSGVSMGASNMVNNPIVPMQDTDETQPHLIVPGTSHSDSQSLSSGPSKGEDDNVMDNAMNPVEEPFLATPHTQDSIWKSSAVPSAEDEGGDDADEVVSINASPNTNDVRNMKTESTYKLTVTDSSNTNPPASLGGFKSRFGSSSFGYSVSKSPLSKSPDLPSSNPSTPERETAPVSSTTARYRRKMVPPSSLHPASSYESGGRSPSSYSDYSHSREPLTNQDDDDDDDDEEDDINDAEQEEEEKQVTAESTKPLNVDGDVIRYNVKELLKHQKDFLQIKWSLYDIPRSVRMFCQGVNNEKYMEDVVAMFERKSDNPWTFGVAPSSKKDKLFKKLTGVLNKMTPEKFDRISRQSMDIVNEFAATKDEMEDILGLILKFGIKQPAFCNQYAKLCHHLHEHLSKLALICEYDWIANDNDISSTFRRMVIKQTNDLFTQHKEHSPKVEPTMTDGKDGKEPRPLSMDPEDVELRKAKRKDAFFAVMVLVAALYNVDLIKKSLVYKGVMEVYLPKTGETDIPLSSVDVEGICRLFKTCGKKLDGESSKHVDRYLGRLVVQSKKFDFRTKVLVDEVSEMRGKRWEARLKKEVAQTLEQIHEKFEKEQAQANGNKSAFGYNKRGDRGDKRYPARDRGDKRRRNDRRYDGDDYYEDDYYYQEKGGGDRYTQKSTRKLNGGYSENNSRYKPKHSPDKDNATAKQFGLYQKKTTPQRRIVGRPMDSGKRSSSGSLVGTGMREVGTGAAGGGGGGPHEKMKKKLKGCIKEYVASGVLDDILDCNIKDTKIWKFVLIDVLTNFRAKEIKFVIDCVLDCFENRIFSENSFQNDVVKYMVLQIDDNAVDCPMLYKYVGQLLAGITYNGYMKPAVFTYFFKNYKEYSEMDKKSQKRSMSKLFDAALDEAERLGADRGFVNKLGRCGPDSANSSWKNRR